MIEIPNTWYVSEEPKEIVVVGVPMMIKEISADDYAKIVTTVTKGSRFDSSKYGDLLIEKMVQDPKIENIAMLKPGIRGQLIRELESALGISEEALKNSSSG